MSMHIKTGDEPSLTQQFTQFIVDQQFKDLSQEAIHAAKRGVLDWLGCALAASHHPTVEPLIEVLQENDSSPQATVMGRSFKLSHVDAPLVNGQMGHLLDFDDTHMGGVVYMRVLPPCPLFFLSLSVKRAQDKTLYWPTSVGLRQEFELDKAPPIIMHKDGT